MPPFARIVQITNFSGNGKKSKSAVMITKSNISTNTW